MELRQKKTKFWPANWSRCRGSVATRYVCAQMKKYKN